MSLHVFAAVVTGQGTAANNRGLTEGNLTTLQKLVWNGEVHTTVSAESIRFALRRRLGEKESCNRSYNEDARANEWADPKFEAWSGGAKQEGFIDDDLLGFMSAEGAKQEGEKGAAKVRRAVLEVSRAVSLTPWPGDVTFNAASPGATPSAQKKGSNPVPYGTEMHATRYHVAGAPDPPHLDGRGRAGRQVGDQRKATGSRLRRASSDWAFSFADPDRGVQARRRPALGRIGLPSEPWAAVGTHCRSVQGQRSHWRPRYRRLAPVRGSLSLTSA